MVERGQPVTALGLMSGTSMDGVDAALLRTDGEVIAEFPRSRFIPYTDAQRAVLTSGLGLWPGEKPDVLDEVAEIVHATHWNSVKHFSDLNVIGFHGQTLAHDPARARTHQVGDGARLARETGNRVVWDFRSADMAAGGQGAPLAPFFHFACAKWAGIEAPVVFLNLGGVANITLVDPACERPEDAGALLAFDTGPASALLDDFVRKRSGAPFDRGGELARKGEVRREILDRHLAQEFFSQTPPKSLDRNDFQALENAVEPLSTADGAATLAAFSAQCVRRAFEHLPTRPERLLVCGGGRKNRMMMEMIATETGADTVPVEAIGLDGDMLEAQAFAYLAVRVLRGLPTSAPGTTGCSAPVCGGRISRF